MRDETLKRPRPTRRRVCAGTMLALLGLVLPVASGWAVANPQEAEQFIDRFGRSAVAVLENRSLDRQAKIAALTKLLDEAIDLELVSRLVLGKYWREASEAQRKEYTRLFRELAIKAMADRLNEYGGETYEVVSSRQVDERDSTVATRILRPNGLPPVKVDWRIRNEGRMSIIDIVPEGVSLIVTQRSEVNDVAAKRGIDGLLAEMRARLQARSDERRSG